MTDSTTMLEKVKSALEEIRPKLQADGGDIELVDIQDDGTVNVRLKGACSGCPFAVQTLKQGVEVFLKERVLAVKTVKSV